MSEHRKETRQRVFLKGRIMFNHGASSMDCLVRDLSTSGARLALTETATLPEAFDLLIPQKDRTYRSMLRWRRDDAVGITFAEAAGAEPVAAASAPPLAPPAPALDASLEILLRRIGELESENAALRRVLATMSQPASPATAA
ncbi:PilZ domain-containing protein [Methylobacterium planeticum]|uniref:PilZ domain-containing protein n=1 Tax=Methylobacterium planeticum TaxID=2615211 RepID=A0A6N6MP40_9HYPH|nr:PilZ domain-containing protein [Methylobacterium planeticum]KAB1071774.1 PilZ domain-containing protein [Methylobacterium planeticum]